MTNLTLFEMFGKTKELPLFILFNRKVLTEGSWEETLWVEREEDWYSLQSIRFRGKRVRIIDRKKWLAGREVKQEY